MRSSLRGNGEGLRTPFILFGLLLVSFLRSGSAFGAEGKDGKGNTTKKHFTTPDGIRLEIHSENKELSKEEMAGTLEKWAQQLRGTPGPDLIQYVPVPGSTPAASTAPAAARYPTPAEMAVQRLMPTDEAPPVPARRPMPASTATAPVPERIVPVPHESPASPTPSPNPTGSESPAYPLPDAPVPSNMPSLAQMASDGNGFHIIDQGESISGFETVPTCVLLPRTLLWTPPLANPLEPRSYVKATTLQNANVADPLDTAIGGTFGLVRYHPTGRNDKAWQLDFFAVAFSRWNGQGDGVAVDWRVGLPVTFARGPWEGKIAYEHTSTHLSDEFAERTGRRRISNTRDEVVLGLAYRFLDDFRAYGILGFALSRHIPGDDKSPLRFDCGLEWCSPCATGWRGRPFAAVDLEFRGEQDHTANFNSQIGWMWRGYDYGHALRLALEYYTGRSTYGQFFLDRENWFGIALLYDF